MTAEMLPALTPERELWRSVARQVVLDAAEWGNPFRDWKKPSEDAVEWLFDPEFEEDRRMVCEFSGASIGWMRASAKALWLERKHDYPARLREQVWEKAIRRGR